MNSDDERAAYWAERARFEREFRFIDLSAQLTLERLRRGWTVDEAAAAAGITVESWQELAPAWPVGPDHMAHGFDLTATEEEFEGALAAVTDPDASTKAHAKFMAPLVHDFDEFDDTYPAPTILGYSDMATRLIGLVNSEVLDAARVTHREWALLLDAVAEPTHALSDRDVEAWGRIAAVAGVSPTEVSRDLWYLRMVMDLFGGDSLRRLNRQIACRHQLRGFSSDELRAELIRRGDETGSGNPDPLSRE